MTRYFLINKKWESPALPKLPLTHTIRTCLYAWFTFHLVMSVVRAFT